MAAIPLPDESFESDSTRSMQAVPDKQAGPRAQTFGGRWAGKFKLAEENPNDDRLAYLLAKYEGRRSEAARDDHGSADSHAPCHGEAGV